MKSARIVILGVAVAAGGLAALLMAGGSEPPPAPAPAVAVRPASPDRVVLLPNTDGTAGAVVVRSKAGEQVIVNYTDQPYQSGNIHVNANDFVVIP